MNENRRMFAAFGIALLILCNAFPAHAAAAAKAHHAIRTANPGAQREFDEGLTLMYAFNPEEALGHFQNAARLDNSLAMAYWGIALTAGPNVNTPYDLERASVGRDASARALALASDDPTRAYVQALTLRYQVRSQNDVSRAERAYADAMGDVARRYPADLDAQTLYAESLMDLTPLAMWHADGTPARDTLHVADILRGVLRRDPNHLGANHLFIHVWEGSRSPQNALESARRLSRLSFEPAEEHLAHMPSHIFMRTGNYDEAIASSLAATALFRTYLHAESSDIHNGYFHHDLQVLDWAYAMTGQWAKARSVATEIAAQVADPAAAAETYVRFGKFQELLALPPPRDPDTRWGFTHGIALACTGDTEGATRELTTLRQARSGDPRLTIAREVLDARLRERRGDRNGAISDLRDAVAREDALPPREPPAWYAPIRESLGGVYLRAGQFDNALRTFRTDLQRNPGSGRSLYGLMVATAHVAPAQMPEARRAFLAAWHHADTKLNVDAL